MFIGNYGVCEKIRADIWGGGESLLEDSLPPGVGEATSLERVSLHLSDLFGTHVCLMVKGTLAVRKGLSKGRGEGGQFQDFDSWKGTFLQGGSQYHKDLDISQEGIS